MSGDVRGRKRRDRPAVPIWTPAFAGEGDFFCESKMKPFPRKRESRRANARRDEKFRSERYCRA